MRLGDKHRLAIHYMLLDRFDHQKQTSWICKKLKINSATLSAWKRNEDFQTEYHHQLDLYRNSFDDIQLADRKERVKALSDLYAMVGNDPADNGQLTTSETKLKMALIEQIRMEMGLGEPAEIRHLHAFVGVNTPPRANTYEEWVAQNQQMDALHGPITPIHTTYQNAFDQLNPALLASVVRGPVAADFAPATEVDTDELEPRDEEEQAA